MIRDHPRFQRTAIIFISAIQLTDVDRLRGYEMGAVDYVPVPVVPDVLRAKVKVFAELYRKTRELERLNAELERRVAERTAELEASNRAPVGERTTIAAGDRGRRNRTLGRRQRQRHAVLAAAGQSHVRNIAGCSGEHGGFLCRAASRTTRQRPARPMPRPAIRKNARSMTSNTARSARKTASSAGWPPRVAGFLTPMANASRVIGTAVEITKRKEAEERQALLAREVDHRARNALAVIQSIVRLTRAKRRRLRRRY